jgi:DNA-directed RNA polymerase specialized sigma24 family protein
LGKSAEDIVADVIVKVFAGDRTWDPARGELLPTLKRHIDSELDHLWNRHARKRERPPPETSETSEAQESAAAALDPTVEPSNPAAHIERREEIVAASARVTALFAAVADHPELQEVIDAVLETGDTEPRHLAEHLNLPVSEINNRLKRLRRRAIT